MTTVSAARVTLIGLAASAEVSIASSVPVILNGSKPLNTEEAELALTRLLKPVVCTAVERHSRLVASCVPPNDGELLLLQERALLTARGDGVVGAVSDLTLDERFTLRGAGVEVSVERRVFEEWARDYYIVSPFTFGIERSTRGVRDFKIVVSFSTVTAIPRSEFLRSLRRLPPE